MESLKSNCNKNMDQKKLKMIGDFVDPINQLHWQLVPVKHFQMWQQILVTDLGSCIHGWSIFQFENDWRFCRSNHSVTLTIGTSKAFSNVIANLSDRSGQLYTWMKHFSIVTANLGGRCGHLYIILKHVQMWQQILDTFL
jgi:hypothetical protein